MNSKIKNVSCVLLLCFSFSFISNLFTNIEKVKSETTLPDGLISYWMADGNANDSSGSNHGVLYNGVSFQPGMNGQAFHFDGIDDYVKISSPTELPLAKEPRTIAFWFKPERLFDDDYQVMFSYGSFSATHLFSLGLDKLNQRTYVGQFGTSVFGNPANLNTWLHLAATYDGTTYKLYENGNLVKTGYMTTNTYSGDLFFGTQFGYFDGTDCGEAGNCTFKGLIDDIQIYNRALTGDEITQVFGTLPTGNVRISPEVEYGEEYNPEDHNPRNMYIRTILTNNGDTNISGKIFVSLNNNIISQVDFPTTGEFLPGETKSYQLPWDLGSNSGSLVNVDLKITVQLSNMIDTDLSDNETSDTLTINWVDFLAKRDGYNFDNYGLEKIQLYEDLFSLYPEYLSLAELTSIGTFLFFYEAEKSGRCFGMASTSILYRDYEFLRPEGYISTYGLDESIAMPMIRKYQRNQLIVDSRKLLQIKNTYNAVAEFNNAKKVIESGQGKPALINLVDIDVNNRKHSVVAYKILETENGKWLYVHDNEDQGEVHWFEVPENDNIFYYDFDIFFAKEVVPLGEDIVVEYIRQIINSWIKDSKISTIFVGSPVEPLLTNSYGNKIGLENGVEVNEIEGAEIIRVEDKTFFILPSEGNYSFEAIGIESTKAESEMKLGYAALDSEGNIIEVSFNSVPIEVGKTYTTTISSSPDVIEPIYLQDGGTIQPDLIEIIEPKFDLYLPLTIR